MKKALRISICYLSFESQFCYFASVDLFWSLSCYNVRAIFILYLLFDGETNWGCEEIYYAIL